MRLLREQIRVMTAAALLLAVDTARDFRPVLPLISRAAFNLEVLVSLPAPSRFTQHLYLLPLPSVRSYPRSPATKRALRTSACPS